MFKISHRNHAFVVVVCAAGLALGGLSASALAVSKPPAQSVARQWNEELLNAIRHDKARPPVHARNLFHFSIAAWDSWAVYDNYAYPYLVTEHASVINVKAAREETMSYAEYRLLSHRFALSPGAAASLASFTNRMIALGYDPSITTVIGSTPAARGNRIAAAVIGFGFADGADEAGDYAPIPPYAPVNPPLVVGLPGNPSILYPNRWQPLALDFFIDQSGIVIGPYPGFICPHWGHVTPFAMTDADEGPPFVYHNPGPMPLLGGVGDAQFKADDVELIRHSSWLTPDDGVMMDISPASIGGSTLGTSDGHGHPLNPATGLPYRPEIVKRGDYGHVIAEFWADGPTSETPPGHWNVLANYVEDYPGFQRRLGGVGPVLDDLEWDVKMYLALNGAMHDAAVAIWGIKGYYDGVRPISSIRYMCGLGQCSDPMQPPFDISGMPLAPGLIEVITPETTKPGGRHESLAGFEGEIAVLGWPGSPPTPATQYSGVRWIRAANWVPYQRPTFVTPPFAGYTSGHSGYSRAGAEILTKFTGTEFFPGGLGTFFAPQNQYLVFEDGPSQNITLQWATYYDAADEAANSRIWGGIHARADDYPSRIIGHDVGLAAFDHAKTFFQGSALSAAAFDLNGDGHVNGVDLGMFLAGWGPCPIGGPCPLDFNGDGHVNGIDLAMLLGHWG